MSRKRTRRLTLVLLSSAGLLATGCGDKVAVPPEEDRPAARLDEATAKRVVAVGTAGAFSDAYLQAAGMLAAGPGAGVGAPLDLATLAYLTDQAVETYDVTANAAQLPGATGGGDYSGSMTSHYTPRSHYYYHRSPGIGWFLFGHMVGSSFSRPYLPPQTYAPTPRPVNPSYGNRSSFGRSGGSSGGVHSSGGSVSRGGFGGSGSAHASGGGGGS